MTASTFTYTDTTSIPEPARSFILPGGALGALCIHGFAGSLSDLRDLALELQLRGLTVAGVRLAGHGQTVEELHRSTVADWQASVRQALVELRRHVQRIVIVGESMGALLALVAAAGSSDVVGVVLLAPPFHIRRERWRRLAAVVLPARFRQRKPWVTDDMLEAYRQQGKLPEVTVGAYRQLLRLVRQARRRLPGMTVPMLAVFDRRDYAVDPRAIETFKELAPQQSAVTHVLDAGQHHLASGPNAVQIAQLIEGFIGQRLGSSIDGQSVV